MFKPDLSHWLDTGLLELVVVHSVVIRGHPGRAGIHWRFNFFDCFGVTVTDELWFYFPISLQQDADISISIWSKYQLINSFIQRSSKLFRFIMLGIDIGVLLGKKSKKRRRI